MKRIIAFLISVVLMTAPASANCMQVGLNTLTLVKEGDVLTTNGPRFYKFPGGFVTQNKILGCDSSVSPNPGAPKCPYDEGNQIAARSGCVKTVWTDQICALGWDIVLRVVENSIVGGQIRRRERQTNEFDKQNVENVVQEWQKDFCAANVSVSIGYAGIVWPNNWRADHDARYLSLAPPKPGPAISITLKTGGH